MDKVIYLALKQVRRETARPLVEALEGMIQNNQELASIIFKVHISSHVSPVNPPSSCVVCKDANLAQENVARAKQALTAIRALEGR